MHRTGILDPSRALALERLTWKALGLILGGSGLLLFAVCWAAVANSGPGWHFDSTDVDVGELMVGQEVLVRFPARNAGWRQERIVGHVPASCGREGCIEAVEDDDLVLAPGKTGEYVVKYTARFAGNHLKTFKVFTAGDTTRQHTLQIRCHAIEDEPKLSGRNG
jgi:hypothetical protein